MLLLRVRWCGAIGGFELIICRLLSEHPRPTSLLLSVCMDESDEIDNFFRVFSVAVVESFWWDDASVCFATDVSDNKSSSLSGWTESTSISSQDRSSVRLLPNDFRNLSTSRTWNLFRLPWLPDDGFGGLQFFVGLVNELCDVRDDVRENARDWLRFM